ncbi:MAG: ribonuclease III [Candidatus Ureaplasma intestinipullorum]|uniref:Ribonuclease 3 n=1 Tax=Candidatus Ureaplasma intestinipullorum TaxID=2838770 RepID=A0A9E2KUT9_9BACT|nr:ribonuclease III [Candidatus Ureaplasma intestinipullorum]
MINKNLNIKLLESILKTYNIRIQKISNYIEAFTHPTYANENNLKYNYERFEFLGDAAISWIITNYLFSYTKNSEGLMSTIKAKLVSGTNFTNISRKIGLDKLLLVGHGMIKDGITDKVLENVFEAFIGAIAQDSGIKKASNVVYDLIITPFLKGDIFVGKPYKTLIQEALGRTEKNDIKYIPMNSKNDKPRKVKLVFNNNVYGYGIGKTLHEAEEAAAHDAYKKLSK